jgi:hypothetical protein
VPEEPLLLELDPHAAIPIVRQIASTTSNAQRPRLRRVRSIPTSVKGSRAKIVWRPKNPGAVIRDIPPLPPLVATESVTFVEVVLLPFSFNDVGETEQVVPEGPEQENVTVSVELF